jgi:hypothetical protein
MERVLGCPTRKFLADWVDAFLHRRGSRGLIVRSSIEIDCKSRERKLNERF